VATELSNGSPGPEPGDQAASQELIERVEALSAEVDRLPDPHAREVAGELLASVLELYGQGLGRMLEIVDEAGAAGARIREALVDDGVVASLLLIHDLYPIDLETRVREALDEVRPYMESHGGNVELLGLADGIARLRLEGSCDGCPASSSTLELAIKQALDQAAPDLAGLEVEGMAEGLPADRRPEEISGTPLPVVHVNGDAASAPAEPTTGPAGWIELALDRMPEPGAVGTAEIAGLPLLIANVSGSLLAFRDRCAACGEPLAAGELKGGVLACPACERRFYLPRAGRSMDEERLLLEPVPLLAQDGGVRIAVSR
jgi:Fe-S cluster biogenesis protein NfuA/nitrite reductase/ring-hydroxylating ferredoxin subunit